MSVEGSDPVLGLEDLSSSSATLAGQPPTCVSATGRGKRGTYCVTKQGLLSYTGSSSSYVELTKYPSKPPASLFSLPTGAATRMLPGGTSTP